MKTTTINNAEYESAHKKTMTGVIHTQDGSIICARLKMTRGGFKAEAVNSWPASNIMKTAVLLSGGAVCGIDTEWRREAPNAGLEPPLPETNAEFNPYLNSQRASIIMEALGGNITSVVTQDSFLLTLPLAFSKEPPVSFLSVFYENGIAVFGIVIERKLEAVFSFPCAADSCIEASAARVRRYWSCVLKRSGFPQKVFVLGGESGGQSNNYDGLEPHTLTLPQELCESGAMRAAGAALTALYAAPTFKIPPQHSFKIYRPILLKAAAVLLCISLLTTAVPVTANFFAKSKLSRSEKIYNLKLNENRSLQELEKTAEELSAKVLSIKKTYSQSSRWGNVLRLLAEIKPQGLFLERLGSDQIPGTENKIRIALTGWAQSESSVTEFISGLQSSDYINSASLTSMERDAKNKNLCNFRILCVTQLLKD
ncbi:MAG: PilN domain-containing protein [Chitinispirillales bacterium]|nr:PilN domain-containing protein [Chitinispirillales bacterium]